MPRKVLLSFVGNNHYKRCCYQNDLFKSKVVRFFQEALLEMLTPVWTKQDNVYIFLTAEAFKNNWQGQFYKGKGLQATLTRFSNFSITPLTAIPTGVSEKEIWRLFERIYAILKPNDEVYLDITHGFRSLPMLLMVLLDYAKTLKGIQVKKIYYGAFEALGPYPKIEENTPKPEDRIAPILDLTSFSALQDWTAAAADFKFYGKFGRLEALTNQNLEPILQNEKDRESGLLLKHLNILFKSFVDNLQANRGEALKRFAYNDLQSSLTKFSNSKNLISPLNAVIQEIQKKVANFYENDDLFWLKAASWCHYHGLIQQGITQLREGFITWLCLKFQREIDPNFFDYTKANPRVLITNAFTIHYKKLSKSKWHKKNADYKIFTEAVLEEPVIQQSADLFINLGLLRNDINHGGYQHYTDANLFAEKLNEAIEALTQLIQAENKEKLSISNVTGLINMTIIPFERWSDRQKQYIQQQYGAVKELAFPEIALEMSQRQVTELIMSYYRKIKALNPKAVCISGELTFTFGLVQKLKSASIICFTPIVGTNFGKVLRTSEEDTEIIGFRTF